MWDSEPRPEKSNEKWVKGREMSQISYWKDFQWRLWVLEVTYHFKAGAVNITINFTSYRFCNFYVFLAAILRETASQLVAAASSGRLEECNQTRTLSVFFELSWLSIDTWLGNEPYNSKIVWSLTLERAWKISCQLVRTWDRSWNRENHDKVVRLGKSG